MSTSDEMPFTQHLEELRNRLGHTIGAIFVCSIACFAWADVLFHLLSTPLVEAVENPILIGTGPAEAFIVKLKVAIVAGIIISLPYTFLQVWKFIAPGLHENERHAAVPFVFFTTVFFLVGASFCFWIVLPFAFSFFETEYLSIGVEATIKIGEYLSFVTKLLLVFGSIFELPILSYFLTKIGLLNYRWLIKQARLSIVLIFVIAAILTPPDIATQVLLALPLILLYCLAIGISYAVNPNPSQKD